MYKRLQHIDIGLLATFGINLYFIWEYVSDATTFDNILLLFYVQSLLIGFFNAINIFTLTNVANKGVVNESRGCTGLFFMVHYGGFHLVYLFFLPSIINIKNIDFPFFIFNFYILVTASIISFIQDKMRNRTMAVDVTAMFFMPYARIIPMHLAILAPKFFNIHMPVLFLSLKTVADAVTYIIYNRAVFKPLPAKSAA